MFSPSSAAWNADTNEALVTALIRFSEASPPLAVRIEKTSNWANASPKCLIVAASTESAGTG